MFLNLSLLDRSLESLRARSLEEEVDMALCLLIVWKKYRQAQAGSLLALVVT